MKRCVMTLLLAFVLTTSAGAVPAGFAPVTEPRTWSFPRDHGAHREFQTEWWYWTGHLESDGHRYGYEIVFFRRAPDRPTDLGTDFAGWSAAGFYPAHVALTDIEAGSFHHEQRIRRDIGGVAGSDSSDLRVWCGNWRAERKGDHLVLSAGSGDWWLDLEMTPDKAPVLHGDGGLSRKGPLIGQASHYYSLTRLSTRGTLTRAGRVLPVVGQSWMDHEFFSSDLDSTLVGWDWFSLQFDDRTELMLYRLRGQSGAADANEESECDRGGGGRDHQRLELALHARDGQDMRHADREQPDDFEPVVQRQDDLGVPAIAADIVRDLALDIRQRVVLEQADPGIAGREDGSARAVEDRDRDNRRIGIDDPLAE